MDFIRVAYKEDKTGIRQFYPALQAIESQDLVIRGGQFAAIWDDSVGLYNRRMSHMPSIIDRAFVSMVGEQMRPGDSIMKVKDFDNQIFNKLLSLIRGIGDMGPELDTKLIFADQTPTKADGATFKLPYALSDADCPAWDEVCATLYGPEERLKFEYAIGSIITGYSLRLHKLYVFYGAPGTGKSTIMDIIQLLFQGHTAAFDAYELGSNNSSFPLEPFQKNPLVAIDQDADLSKVDTNVFLNKLVAHDKIQVNSKGKSLFEIHPRCCMFVGTNKPVKMTDSRSGLYRRVVDIHPTGILFDETEYRRLTAAMTFELGAIAQHCVNVFTELGPQFFTNYKPTDMMSRTNDVYNFIQDNRLILMKGITVKNAAQLYSEWCEETETRNVYKQYQLRDILKDYFEEWHEQIMIDGVRHRSWLQGLKEIDTFSWKTLNAPDKGKSWLDLSVQESTFDKLMADMPAQYSQDHPVYPLKQAWDKCTTTLKDLDTSQEHYVKVPTQHIVIDFDLKDANGNDSLAACIEAAALWPPTYAESSRSGEGLHLHYEYDGRVEDLGGEAGPGVEVKSLLGGASLRRRYTVSNGLPISQISSGLPIKEDKPVISAKTMASEAGLRKQILRGLTKEVHPYTKPSMDFIKKVLEDAVAQGLVYDVSDMWDDILEFAMGSSNQQAICINIAMNLPLKSEDDVTDIPVETPVDLPIADFDLEVYPNLFAFAYQPDDSDVVIKMINPKPEDIRFVVEHFRLVGFYNRLYDNHIVWGAMLGYSNEELYRLSQAIIVENNRHKLFGAAYGLAYADLYDIATTKQSLKKWEIDLGLPHMEMDLPWDQPVPENRILDVMDYLENDVRSTRAVRKHIESDWRAREILCELTGLQMSNKANDHTMALVFGDERDPSKELRYTDLKIQFPGYEFDRFAAGKGEKSTYKGIKVGEGGYVFAEEGAYHNVVLLDVASMHPTSIIQMNMFGKYTKNYESLLQQRLEVKAKIKTAQTPEEKLEYVALSDALKLAINSVYGLTAASFPNKFRHPDNIDNIVAKRGALFMVDLKEFIENELGLKVIHIKTDSVKVQNADAKHIEWIQEFSRKYGYDMEHEATYEKFVLFNDAVYIARKDGEWSATGKQFQHPVVFKTLLSQKAIVPADYVEVKQVSKGHMYLINQDESVKTFVGKFGAFVPVIGGRQLVRIDGEKTAAVTGTTGYLWELDTVAHANNLDVDVSYFQELVDKGKVAIEKHIPYEELIA